MAFDKFKQLGELNKMRQEAKKLQKELEKEEVTYEKGAIKIKVNGAQQIVYFQLDDSDRDDIKEAINEAMKEVQKKAARKMMEMGGGLSGLFGK
ncbi:YbaB/EbfC family nucleoid-associated protein [Candidatus Woesebacteria bacterium]|nr:MAG: YbaB/EbfC family nucleoid-associated protein [Candidatus Woesebacteria bacterium]